MKTADEILAENNKLTADLSAAQKTITDLNAQIATSATATTTLTGERDTLYASLTKATTDVAAVTKERDTLKAENTKLQGDMKDFEGRVAAAVVQKGIKAGTVKEEVKSNKPKTATDLLLEAKGVKSLDELAAQNKAKR